MHVGLAGAAAAAAAAAAALIVGLLSKGGFSLRAFLVWFDSIDGLFVFSL